MFRKIINTILLIIIHCSIITAVHGAAANFKSSYQGYIKENGVPVTGTKWFTFRVRNGSGGAIQWESSCTDIAVSSGVFRATLGDTNAVGNWGTVDWQSIDAHLEVVLGDAFTCNNPVSMLPQERLFAVPYSLISSSAGALLNTGTDMFVNSSSVSVNGVDMYFLPQGTVMFWSGSTTTIPSGWALCDGTNGTPNLMEKFVVAARQDDTGVAKTNVTGSLTQSGGNTQHQHTTPTHTHDVNVGSPGLAATSSFAGCCGSANSHANTGHTHSVTFLNKTSTTASPTSDNTTALPPYYALAYIMKL